MYPSVCYPEDIVRCLRARQEPWAQSWKQQVVAATAPWLAMSDDALWALVFSHRLTRAWQVWSHGHCPVCRASLPEYTWVMDGLARPWKTRCPHCNDVFPKNDFAAYHRSGLDETGFFDPARGDHALLFNVEHPDPADPLHTYGVDDGNGWSDGTNRWRFIAAYLIYGQWKQLILGGITRCAAAYLATGCQDYANKALLLLDRVADVYPHMDFSKQGLVYEVGPHAGFVTVWHDACEEIAELALAYDAVRPALPGAKDLVAFLAAKARQFTLGMDKDSPAAIREHIERDLLQHTVAYKERINSNFPRTDLALVRILSVLDATAHQADINTRLQRLLSQGTAVDGVTGEKGLNGYASWTCSGIFEFMAQLAITDEARFRELLAQHPRLHAGVRFFLDTWCLRKFYPSCGDAGAFTQPQEQVAAFSFESYQVEANTTAKPGLGLQFLPRPSPHALLWALYKATGDVDLLRLSRLANDSADGQLRFGLLAETTPAMQAEYRCVLAEHGPELCQGSIDKPEWHLAILRSGQGAHERALWLDYDTGRNHHHFDGMNLGLFACGMDLLPDFGYPPTGYGGHETLEAMWYVHTAAHNTVVVDGQCQPGPHWTRDVLAAGRNDIWVDTTWTRGLRNDAPKMYPQTSQYERMLWLTDISDRAFYVLDIFRVLGGADHAKFTHSGQATLEVPALRTQPIENFVDKALLRNLCLDARAPAAWSAEFHIQDPHNYRRRAARRLMSSPETVVDQPSAAGEAAACLHLRVHDLTGDARAGTAESWVNDGGYNVARVLWIPTLMTRRQGEGGRLASTFVAVLEPFEKTSAIRAVRRAALETADGRALGSAHVALAVELADGHTDHYVMVNAGPHHGDGAEWRPGLAVRVPEWGLETDAEACVLRRGPGACPEPVICRGTYARLAPGQR